MGLGTRASGVFLIAVGTIIITSFFVDLGALALGDAVTVHVVGNVYDADTQLPTDPALAVFQLWTGQATYMWACLNGTIDFTTGMLRAGTHYQCFIVDADHVTWNGTITPQANGETINLGTILLAKGVAVYPQRPVNWGLLMFGLTMEGLGMLLYSDNDEAEAVKRALKLK
jgi:hypothetical protein